MILVGVTNERASKTLENVVEASLANRSMQLSSEMLDAINAADYVKYGLKQMGKGYELQSAIDQKIGISISSVYEVGTRSRLCLCGDEKQMQKEETQKGGARRSRRQRGRNGPVFQNRSASNKQRQG